jgi:phosphoglycerol transferase
MLFFLILLLITCFFILKGSLKQKLFPLAAISFFYFCLTFYSWQSFDLPLMDWRVWMIPFIYSPLNSIFSLLYALIIADTTWLFQSLKTKKRIIHTRKMNRLDWFGLGTTFILTFFGFLFFGSSRWAIRYFDNLKVDQIIYTLSQPLTGTDPAQIKEFLVDPLLFSIIGTLLMTVVLYFFNTHTIHFKPNYPLKKKKHKRYSALIIGIFSCIFGAVLGVKEIGYTDVRAFFFEHTELYDNYYVDPRTVELKFPEQKRNLIYIFLESMESSYASKEMGGIKENNLIPNLTHLAQTEGIHFSNSDQLGGMLPIPSASHTASSMVAQTSGLPLRTSSGLHVNHYGQSGDYLPGAYSLGTILKNEGYSRTLLMGSDADFAARSNYFTQHGEYDIRDYNWAKETGRIPEDYRVWWGYEDAKLFEFAKETLTELGKKEQPFNFTMLTADTHFEDGLMTDETPKIFEDQYSNVIHFSDQEVYSLLQWIKEQPFYENTTIILVGDHLTMDKDFFEAIDSNYQRTVYNVILNSKLQTTRVHDRLFSAVDMFPTTLAALGVEIPGDRLGIGTNLFSERPTIMEELGYDQFYTELSRRSHFYERNIIQGTDRAAAE